MILRCGSAMILRWRWVRAYRMDLEFGVDNPYIRAWFMLRYNITRFWWMKELKDEDCNRRRKKYIRP